LDLEDANDQNHTVFSGIQAAISEGLLAENDVDQSVSRLFYVRMKLGEFDDPAEQPYRQIPTSVIRSPAHLALSQQVATKSLVLLENKNRTLPLSLPRGHYSISVVGPFADCQSCVYGKYSPHLDEKVTTTVAKGLKSGTPGNVTVKVAAGCSQHKWPLPLTTPPPAGVQGDCGCVSCPCPAGGGAEPYMCEGYNRTEVIEAIRGSNLCVLTVGLGSNVESEGRDREALGLALPGQQNVLVRDAIAAAKKEKIPVVALLFVAGPVDPELFAEVDAVIDCFYPAEKAGEAIAAVFYGQESPAGRLPFSWPTTAMDVPPEANYTMVGRTYRYSQRNVKWPFGYGLSYSTFSYSGATVITGPTVAASECRHIRVQVTVANTGDIAAEEVVQGYLEWRSVDPAIETPARSLFDFARISLQPGQNATVKLSLAPKHYAVLTAPRCGVVPFHNGTELRGDPFEVKSGIALLADCCSSCSSLEMCEAFTYLPETRECRLYHSWGLTINSTQGAVSGEPLNEWVLRRSELYLLVGGSSSAASLVGAVAVEGAEVPLTKCTGRFGGSWPNY